MNDSVNLRVDRRHRGNHSTVCKCPYPEYIRPVYHKQLAGEHGRALRNLQYRDKTTGKMVLRRRVSADPIFTFLRALNGRKRQLSRTRQDLLDALYVLFINKVDLATSIVTTNLSKMAEELSPRDSDGKVIHDKAMTVHRISRLVKDLIDWGFLEAPENEWDPVNGCRFPKHVILTDMSWQLTGVDMDKLRAQREMRQQAVAAGILAPGEDISDRSLQRRWYENMRLQTLIKRRSRAVEEKMKRKLQDLPFDERKRQVSERMFRTLKDNILYYTPAEFEKLVWKQLYQMELVYLDPPTSHRPH